MDKHLINTTKQMVMVVRTFSSREAMTDWSFSSNG